MVAVDKLTKLRANAGVPHQDSYGSLSEGPENQGPILSALMEMHNQVLPQIQEIKQISEDIQQQTRLTVVATSSEKERRIAQKVNQLVDVGKQKIADIKEILDNLKGLQNAHGPEMSPAESQMCASTISIASNSFKHCLTEYMRVQEEYKTSVRDKVERQLRIAYPDAPDQDIRELSHEDPQSVREAIQQQLKRGGEANLHGALYDLHGKYNDLKNLEESVIELRDLFLYLGALVDEQGRLLDNIEANVENTKEYTGAAVEHLHTAKEHKDAYDRKRFWIMLATSGTCFIALVIIIACLGPTITRIFCCGGSSSGDSGGIVNSGPGMNGGGIGGGVPGMTGGPGQNTVGAY